jgi:hypothetical protein
MIKEPAIRPFPSMKMIFFTGRQLDLRTIILITFE